MENIDETNLPFPFVKPFDLISGTSVKDMVDLILIRKSLRKNDEQHLADRAERPFSNTAKHLGDWWGPQFSTLYGVFFFLIVV